MEELLKLVDKVASRKLWLGVVLPAWMLMQKHIEADDFVILASVAIGGMALVDFGRAITGNTLEGWRVKFSKVSQGNDVEVFPRTGESK